MWRIAAGNPERLRLCRAHPDKMSHDFKFFYDDQSIYFDLNYILQGIFDNRVARRKISVDFSHTINLSQIRLARGLPYCAPGLLLAPILIEEKKDGRQNWST